METYKKARERLLADFASMGYEVKPNLKIPQVVAKHLSGTYTLFFHAQAVYLDAHSLFVDIRGMGTDMLLAHVEKARRIRSASNLGELLDAKKL